MRQKFLKDMELTANAKTEKFFKSTTWENMVSSYSRTMKAPWDIIRQKAAELDKLAERLK